MLSQKELDTKTNEELLILYKQTNDQKIKQTLVLRYIYIVKNIAMQMRGIYLGFSQIDDIINEGVLAIMTAIDKFDINKHVKFETYISKRIRGMIIDIARKQDWVPRSIRKSAKEIEEAQNILKEKGKAEENISISTIDVPMMRKGDKVKVFAGNLSGYFIVEGITHNGFEKTMELELERI